MDISRGGYLYYIDSCFIEKDYRGKGVFQKMFQFAIDFAKKDQHCIAVWMLVDMDNTGAMKLYEKLGMSKADVCFLEGYDYFIKS